MNDQDMSIHNQQKDIHPRKKISTKLLTLLCKREFIARNKSLFTGDFCTRLYTQLLLENRKSEAKLLILSIIENLSGDSILIEKILAAAAENLDIHTCKQATKLLIQKNVANGLIIRFEEGIIAHDYALRSSISSTWDAYLFKSFKKQKNLLKADISKLKSIKKQIFFCSSSLSSSKKNTTHNLQNTGYIFNKCTIQEEQCNVMVETFKTANNLINDELITLLNRQKVIEKVILLAQEKTGYQHVIWHCLYQTKNASENTLTSHWHLDNHFSDNNPKIIIYLNDQSVNGGATDFKNSNQTDLIAKHTSYIGLPEQRKDWQRYMSEWRSKDPAIENKTNDYHRFSPTEAGSSVLFYPSRCLHRGQAPITGKRHVLTMSLLPIQNQERYSELEALTRHSIDLLSTQAKKSRPEADLNPVWIPYKKRVE